MAGVSSQGALQGWLSAGAVGAAGGAVIGLAAAWLFSRKDYGGAYGTAMGAIVGAALGGAVGSLAGAVVGGLIGHFIGKLF